MDKLKECKIVKRQTKTCQCGQNSYIYMIPTKLDENILNYLSQFGNPAFDFKKTSILKIENQNYSITGVRRLREIRLNIKNEIKGFLDLFESALIDYIKNIGEK